MRRGSRALIMCQFHSYLQISRFSGSCKESTHRHAGGLCAHLLIDWEQLCAASMLYRQWRNISPHSPLGAVGALSSRGPPAAL